MLDMEELFYKIEQKQFDLDYNNTLNKDIKEYFKTKGKIEALEYVKRIIANILNDNNLEIDNSIILGEEWN